MEQDDIYFQAMQARDHRFDGKFFVGVKTTGIYCRPICPAKPKRQNVEFFPSFLAAEKAGYRPCLRCRPESAPLSAAWMGTSAVVQRALKVIHGQESIHWNEDEFAERFGVSARHLRRLFIDEIGKTPKQILFEHRLNIARKLVVETHLPMTDIVSASGFQSIRRFNDAFKERFTKAPSDLRQKKLPAKSEIEVSLSYRPPFDFSGLMHFYRVHKVGDLEHFENNEMIRIFEIDGKTGLIRIAHDEARSQLKLKIETTDTSVIYPLIAKVRSLFDLDSDPLIIANAIESDKELKKVLKRHPGIRLPSGWNGFEIAVATILGQLVSVERGRSLVGDLIEMLGKDSGVTYGNRKVKLFPTPKQIAASKLDGLKTTTARKNALREFARAVDEKRLSLEPTQDVNEFLKNVLSIKGIGPWSANYMAMKVLRNTDSFPATDLILARALDLHPEKVIQTMSPWRAYVAALLWREYSDKLNKSKGKKS